MHTGVKILLGVGGLFVGAVFLSAAFSPAEPPAYRPPEESYFTSDTVGCPSADALDDVYSALSRKDTLKSMATILQKGCVIVKAGASWQTIERGREESLLMVVDGGRALRVYVRTRTMK